MRMLETTLLTGPYDWDAALIPRAEFDRRIELVRIVLSEHGLSGLIVGGTSPEFAALSYLTGFVPKLGPALVFIPRQGVSLFAVQKVRLSYAFAQLSCRCFGVLADCHSSYGDSIFFTSRGSS